MRLPLTGGCQCGAVRYEIRAQPLTVYACHCTECQRQSASAFSLSLVAPRDALAIVAGTPKAWRRVVEGTPRAIQCVFCGECGVRLLHNPEHNLQVSIVKPGTLDDASWLEPVGHVWTRSAQSWFEIPDDGVNYDAQPPDQSRLIEAWRARQAAK
jgi:hypothetical protein